MYFHFRSIFWYRYVQHFLDEYLEYFISEGDKEAKIKFAQSLGKGVSININKFHRRYIAFWHFHYCIFLSICKFGEKREMRRDMQGQQSPLNPHPIDSYNFNSHAITSTTVPNSTGRAQAIIINNAIFTLGSESVGLTMDVLLYCTDCWARIKCYAYQTRLFVWYDFTCLCFNVQNAARSRIHWISVICYRLKREQNHMELDVIATRKFTR